MSESKTRCRITEQAAELERRLRSCSLSACKVVLGARGPDRLEALAARIAASGGDASTTHRRQTREDVSNLVGCN